MMKIVYNDLKKEVETLIIRKEDMMYEIELLDSLIESKIECIKKIENYLKELSGVEEKIYYQVIVNGLNVTKAVDRVSLETGLDVSTIWKSYYPKVKQIIKDSSEFLV